MASSSPVKLISHSSPSAGPSLGSGSIAQLLAANCQRYGAASGVVIVQLDARAGTWQYSVDDGASWRDARTDLINRPGTMGLALDRQARLRLLPHSDERVLQIHMVLHAVQRSLHASNGSYSAYVPDPDDGDSDAIRLKLDLNAINGTPPQVQVPRLRRKKALARAAAKERVQEQALVPAQIQPAPPSAPAPQAPAQAGSPARAAANEPGERGSRH